MRKLTCHCGLIEIEIDIKDSFEDLYRCNCSMCIRKGVITAIVNKEDLKIVKGMNKLKSYQFKTRVAKHYFCSNCGIQTHNLRRRDPNTYGINVACIEDLSTNEGKILLSFIDECDLKWRFLHADNFFMSYDAGLTALKKRNFINGTLRRNAANCPHELLDNINGRSLKAGEAVHVVNNVNPVV